MKKLKPLVTALLFLTSLSALAETVYEYTFVVGDNVCAPITVSYAGNTYTVHSQRTITFSSSPSSWAPTAVDCNGNKLKYEYKSNTTTRGYNSYHSYVYVFINHDNFGSSRSSGGSSGGYNGNNGGDNYDSARQAGAALGKAIFQLGGGADGEAYPALSVMPGISSARGENIKLRYEGYGFHAYASIGKDWLFDTDFKNKLLWNVGLGSYFAFGGSDPSMDVSLGLSIGQLSTWEKLSLMIDTDYTYWFGRWRRFGMFAGGGLGWGSFTEMFNTDDYSSHGGFAWNLEIGFIIRIANF